MGNRSVRPVVPADYFTPYYVNEFRTSVPAVHSDAPTGNRKSLSPQEPTHPCTSVTPIITEIATLPKHSPSPPVFSTFHVPEVPLTLPPIDTSSTPGIPVMNTTSPPLAVSVTSPQRVISVSPPPLTVPANSSEPTNPALSPTPSIDDVPIHSTNFIPVNSPDSSAVSPTLEMHITPVTSPIPTEGSTKIVSPSTTEQLNPTTSPSAGRWRKWYAFGQKEPSDIVQETHAATPPSTEVKDDEDIIPDVPNITAVPSYSLRSTAVCPIVEENYVLSERTQSIHTDISIFKFHVTSHEMKPLVGNHSKATMFKMDTRLKKTPLPTPSLSFLSQNFNDDINETNKKTGHIPTFNALGLANDLQRELTNQSQTDLRSPRKSLRTSIVSNSDAQRNDSPGYASTFMLRPSNLVSIENPSLRNQRLPLTSILKKRPSQMTKFHENDFENNPSSSTKKASQSILRSHKLFQRNDYR